jgi:hypothetical protein
MNVTEQHPTPNPGELRWPPSDEHHSYLLRLWRSGADGRWRASLQSVQSGERHMFAELESVLGLLVDQSRSPPQGE